MLISNRYRFIFIHVYKNAGTSISNALLPFANNKYRKLAHSLLKKFRVSILSPSPYPKHIKASELISEIGRGVFDSYFTFAVVRNPWDWQVSLYHYMLEHPEHRQHELVKGFRDFDEYIRWRCVQEIRYQKDFIVSEQNELLVDFVGRFERVQEDFREICSRIGVDATLPYLNKSKRMSYKTYYTQETIQLVQEAFKPDIELFNYAFDNE